jgi:hypothetical protein
MLYLWGQRRSRWERKEEQRSEYFIYTRKISPNKGGNNQWWVEILRYFQL